MKDRWPNEKFGRVEIPQEVFIVVLKINKNE